MRPGTVGKADMGAARGHDTGSTARRPSETLPGKRGRDPRPRRRWRFRPSSGRPPRPRSLRPASIDGIPPREVEAPQIDPDRRASRDPPRAANSGGDAQRNSGVGPVLRVVDALRREPAQHQAAMGDRARSRRAPPAPRELEARGPPPPARLVRTDGDRARQVARAEEPESQPHAARKPGAARAKRRRRGCRPDPT